MNSQTDEDAIDLQDLQAQIDLSMSFAQNLVSSWVKPTHYPQTSRQRNLENEIKEYMHRPARLGVGAPIPETQSLAREAARLKTKLERGKKRQREDKDVDTNKVQSDDEEESRTGAIKKKTRVDPFSAPSKEKKKGFGVNGESGSILHPAAMRAMAQNQSILTGAEDGQEVDDIAAELLTNPCSPKSLKKIVRSDSGEDCQQRKTKSTKSALLSNEETIVNGTPSLKLPTNPEPLKQPKPSALGNVVPSLRTPATSLIAEPKFIDVSLTLTPPRSPRRQKLGAEFLKQPFLNLYGSPSEAESEEGDKSGPPEPPAKKKRKRKKKKKSQQNPDSLSLNDVV
ncbi:hypothetical protein AN958_05474 [Leucoagaricus sp. SymC.cos]|nr:hypothetical protein AN958_05474 [Leucoagaricus sp. SymC.cos]